MGDQKLVFAVCSHQPCLFVLGFRFASPFGCFILAALFLLVALLFGLVYRLRRVLAGGVNGVQDLYRVASPGQQLDMELSGRLMREVDKVEREGRGQGEA